MEEYTVELTVSYGVKANDPDEAVDMALALYASQGPEALAIYVDGKLWN